MEKLQLNIDKTWTLFLDRDGVINHEKKEDYILSWDEFMFYDGVKEAMKIFSERFGVIVMVTNQRGVGKGLMSENDLNTIHQNMTQEIVEIGGRVDRIYFCTSMDNHSPNRKPNAGMALQAKEHFPGIDFDKSIMVGNKVSDMQFGRNAGIKTVFVATTNPEVSFPNPLIDFRFNNLIEFANIL
jgi:histidinol-phosphate phosphatase family protein